MTARWALVAFGIGALAVFAAPANPWRIVTLPRIKPAEVAFEGEGEALVVRIHAQAAAASAVRAWAGPVNLQALQWQWKVDHALQAADLSRKEGDDFAARVYVSFDVPLADLSFATRTRIRIARLLYGDDVPAAAICYVWDNHHAPGFSAWSPYSSQVRVVVVESGNARAGEWVAERRDIARDFAAAFGARHPGTSPRVTGIAVSSDTDQTAESVTAWFRDFAWSIAP